MTKPLPQPIKAIAWSRGITQQRFAIDTQLPYLLVHRVWNGVKPPSDEFIETSARYFELSADQLFRPDR